MLIAENPKITDPSVTLPAIPGDEFFDEELVGNALELFGFGLCRQLAIFRLLLGLGISAHYRITTSLLVGAMFVVWGA
ncbi:hypothetical protein ACGFK1_16170 [Mycobacterium sp. NPDC048908]|uniref:hypothetical protein n=1 Tax=Mycobacterium sp. NPDC048908 TaxID=3364292 RepID=UPI0037233AB2